MYISQAFTDYEGQINSKNDSPTCVTPGVNARGHFGYFGFLCTVFGFLCDLLDSSNALYIIAPLQYFLLIKKEIELTYHEYKTKPNFKVCTSKFECLFCANKIVYNLLSSKGGPCPHVEQTYNS